MRLWFFPLVLILLLGTGVVHAEESTVVFATATSAQDSGLLDLLVPLFEYAAGSTVKRLAVGSGQALNLGAGGEADVVLSQAPELELRYLADEPLIHRRLVMSNDFLLVGPPADPIGIKGMTSAANAFKRIAERQARFVSRADGSGTHQKELALWQAVGVAPKGRWYVQSGQGQGATLILASERGAYALTDRATYLAFQNRLSLAILLEATRSC